MSTEEMTRDEIVAELEQVRGRLADDTVEMTDAEVDETFNRGRELADELARRDDLAEREATRAAEMARFAAAARSGRAQIAPAVVRSEPATYTPGGRSWVADVLASRSGDSEAGERLARHTSEVVSTRDVGTAQMGGLIPPAYLVDEFAAVLRNGRPMLNAVGVDNLPGSAMNLVVPRGQSGSSVAAQATENSAVSETDVDFDNDLTVPVRTFAGQQDVSRQALERGTVTDQLVFADLAGAYAAASGASAINGAGTSGTHKGILNAAGINAVTYTDASPTVAELWSKLADAVQQVTTNRKVAPDLIVMHPRRWAWLSAALDSAGRPLLGLGNGTPGDVLGEGVSGLGAVGQLMGLPVVADANVPTDLGGGTEDAVIVTRRADVHFWEDPGAPQRFSFEQTTGGSLTVKLVLAGYSAFTAERYPVATSVITGTGLAAPSF